MDSYIKNSSYTLSMLTNYKIAESKTMTTSADFSVKYVGIPVAICISYISKIYVES